jgi:isoamylase
MNAPEPRRTAHPGEHYPLGARWDGGGVNFAVFAEAAERVEVEVYLHPAARAPVLRLDLAHRTGPIFHSYVEGLKPGMLYGYRVHGPFEPSKGHRFNPQKLLIDPYTRAIGRPIKWHESLFGYPVGHDPDDLRQDTRDSAPYAPLGAIVDDSFDWQADVAPRTPWQDTIIYEAHVKGATMLHPRVPQEHRGTYLGLASDAFIEHLVELGVTALELLPIQAFVREQHLLDRGLQNYWGYSPLCYFAVEPGYACGNGIEAIDEFKTAVRRLHQAGIEVLIDVVYNHTGEGNRLGPTLCYRGLSNAAYYQLSKKAPRYCADYTGTGNTLNAYHPFVLQMILDSLRYWVEQLHVDGFRFDLATSLGRKQDHVDLHAPFFQAIAQDPVLSRVKLIAEPWDIGPHGYQLGSFPWPWAEWNGGFRDSVRSFFRGDKGQLGSIATRMAGSSDLFADRVQPQASINFITAHDGFTLEDLVSYNEKHNKQNGEQNRDGHDHNISDNCGEEGMTDNQRVWFRREARKRGLMSALLLAQGVPMICAGDELSRTQNGNNNAYCQDNELSWLDWELDERREAFLTFVRDLVAFRKAHHTFRRRYYPGGKLLHPGCKELSWWHPSGREITEKDWHDNDQRCLGMMLCDAAFKSHHAMQAPRKDADETFLLLLNGSRRAPRFVLPEPPLPGVWLRRWAGVEAYHDTPLHAGRRLRIPPASVVVLIHKPD